MAEGAHQLTFPHELGRCSADSGGRDLSRVVEEVVDLFGQMAPGTATSSTLPKAPAPILIPTSYVGEHERSQLRIFGKKALGGPQLSIGVMRMREH